MITDGALLILLVAINGKPGAILPSSKIRNTSSSSVPITISSFPLELKSAKAGPFWDLDKSIGKPKTSVPSILTANSFGEDEKEPNTISKSSSESRLPKAGVPIKNLLAL